MSYRNPAEKIYNIIPNQLTTNSISSRFKTYLMAVEMLIIELPEIIEAIKAELGENEITKRLEKALERIMEASSI